MGGPPSSVRAEGGTLPVARLGLPWGLRLGLVAALVVVVWLLLMPALVTREVSLELRPSTGGLAWAMEWSRGGFKDGERVSGRWLDPRGNAPAQERLVIEPAAGAMSTGEPLEAWVYEIVPLSTPGRAMEIPRPELGTVEGNGRWLKPESGEHVVYSGYGGGRLETVAPSGGVVVSISRGPRSGKVRLTYADAVVERDLAAAAWGRESITLTRKFLAPSPYAVKMMLPASGARELRLRAVAGEGADPPGAVEVRDAKVRVRLAGIPVAQHALQVGAMEAVGGGGEIRLVGETGVAFWVRGAALVLVAAGAAVSWGAWKIAVWSITPLARRGVLATAILFSVIVAFRVIATWATPFMMTSDGVDYLGSAERLAATGDIDSFPAYKAPLMTVLTAIPMWMGIHPFSGLEVMHLVFGLATTVLTYATLRQVVSGGWTLAGTALVGLNPLLITMESYLLRETTAALIVAAMAYVLIVLMRPEETAWKRRIALAVLAGVIAAMGALLRENFLVMLALVPLGVLAAPFAGMPWSRRAVLAGVMLGTGLVLATPYMAFNAARLGTFSMTVPKVHINRALNAWSNETLDVNQSDLIPYEQWVALERDNAVTPLGDYDVMMRFFEANPQLKPEGLQLDPALGRSVLRRNQQLAAVWHEGVSKLLTDESDERHAGAVMASRVQAAASLMGLWSFESHRSAAATTWLSTPFRRRPFGHSTNVLMDMTAASEDPRFRDRWGAIVPLVEERTVDLDSAVPRVFAQWFNQLFWSNQVVRPVLALAVFAGVWWAVRRREWRMVLLGAVVLVNVGAAAWAVVTPVDRFAVPLIPMMVVVAVWGVVQMGSWARAARGEVRA